MSVYNPAQLGRHRDFNFTLDFSDSRAFLPVSNQYRYDVSMAKTTRHSSEDNPHCVQGKLRSPCQQSEQARTPAGTEECYRNPPVYSLPQGYMNTWRH